MALQQTIPPGRRAEVPMPLPAPVDRDRSFLYDLGALEPQEEKGYLYERHLPPDEFWLLDPYAKANKIDTPVDERGLVDPLRLITAVKDMIDPSYPWGGRLSIHHLYWNGMWYGLPSAGGVALKFREYPIHKILVPRIFENCIHHMTEPPDIPSREVMQHRGEAWGVANNLFKSVRSIAEWEKKASLRKEQLLVDNNVLPKEFQGEDRIGREVLRHTLSGYFRGVELHMDQLHAVPSEFRLIQPEQGLQENEDRRRSFTKQLGRLVVPRALPMTRAVLAA